MRRRMFCELYIYIYIYSRIGMYIYICLWHGVVHVFRIARVIYFGCPRFWVLEK